MNSFEYAKKMFGKVFNSNGTHKTGCLCKSRSDQDLVIANSVRHSMAFSKYCGKNSVNTWKNYQHSADRIETYDCKYELDGEITNVTYGLESGVSFHQSACLTCGTDMGWKLVGDYMTTTVESPEAYVHAQFEKHNKQVRLANERKLQAKGICDPKPAISLNKETI